MTITLDTASSLYERNVMPRPLLMLILIPFSVLSAIAMWQHGYWGILAPHFQTSGAGQVLADLVIALSLVMVWMWRDAKASGRKVWPWIIFTLIAGSFGPLIYLLTRKNPEGIKL
jgi:Terpene cyclase DEP1